MRGGSNRLEFNEFHCSGGTVQDDFLRVWGENFAHLLGSSRIVIFSTEARMPIDFRITAEVVSFGALIIVPATVRRSAHRTPQQSPPS